MAEGRKSYTREFRIEAVRMAAERGYSLAQVSRDLGITTGMLARWKKQLEQDPDYAFPGKGRLRAPEEEIRALQREVERLRMERDILKKTIAIFSKGPR